MSAGPREPRETVAAAIWAELRRQAEEDTFGPCVVESDGIVDGSVDMGAVAAAVVEALGLTEETDTHPIFVVNDPLEMDDRLVVPKPKSHIEWLLRRRWVSGWSVVGGEPT